MPRAIVFNNGGVGLRFVESMPVSQINSNNLIFDASDLENEANSYKLSDGNIIERDEAEITAEQQELRWERIRAIREFKLRKTDFEALKAYEGNPSDNWLDIKANRQRLRDIPQQMSIEEAESFLEISNV